MHESHLTTSLPANGLSMFPFILPGSRLSVKPIDAETVRVGNIVCYPAEKGKMVAHRVVEIYDRNGERFFFVRGDLHVGNEVIPSSAAAFVVYRVEHRLMSYYTDGFIGSIIVKLVLSDVLLSTKVHFALLSAARFYNKSISVGRKLREITKG